MTETAHPVSETIRSLYEEYPYPPPEEGMLLDPYLDLLVSFSEHAPEGRPAFLDAGCGTGMMTLGGARLYPHFDVYGCDFNREALKVVRRNAREYGADNVKEVREVDLLDFPEDFGPERGFDVIYLTGVIHHTPDPVGIVRSLAGRLAPNGVMRLMVYSESGRASLYRFARVAKALFAGDDAGWKEQIDQARSLMLDLYHHGLQQGMFPPPLRGPFEGAHELDDAEFADRYLNPFDVPFTLDTLADLITECGLVFHSWFERRAWDLGSLLPNLAQSGRLPDQEWECYRIVEQLFDRDQYDLYLVGPDFQPRLGALTPETLVGANAQVELIDRYFRGIPCQSTARLLFHPPEELTMDEARMMRELGGTWKTLAAIAQDWKRDVEDVIGIAASLFVRDLLFTPHPSDLPR